MAIQARLYTIDDVWDFAHQPGNDSIHFELIDGDLLEMAPPGLEHGSLASLLTHYLLSFVMKHNLGIVTVETGYHPPETRITLLSPDVAFLSRARMPQSDPVKYVPVMPDLAVEIMSPRDSLRQLRSKASLYLRNGTELVWIVKPTEASVEVCRAGGGAELQIDSVGRDGKLLGEPVLPGFELELKRLFPSSTP